VEAGASGEDTRNRAMATVALGAHRGAGLYGAMNRRRPRRLLSQRARAASRFVVGRSFKLKKTEG